MDETPETPPLSAAFSFKVKSLLLDMFVRTRKINRCLDQLAQGEEALTAEDAKDALAVLEAEAKELHAISSINLPTLSWSAASLELTDREALAVDDTKERVKALADRTKEEPLRSRKDAETAFTYIRWIAWSLEEIQGTMQREEDIALDKVLQRQKENKQKSWSQKLWTIGIGIGLILVGFFLDKIWQYLP